MHRLTCLRRLRRLKVLKDVNPSITGLAVEDLFREAAPELFGAAFEVKMKSRADGVKILSPPKSNPQQKRRFFHQVAPMPPERRLPVSERKLVQKRSLEAAHKEVDTLKRASILSHSLSIQSLKQLMVEPKITGRIALFYANWQIISQDQWILDTNLGYKIDFLSSTTQWSRPRACVVSSRSNPSSKGAITEVPLQEAGNRFYSSLFLVPKKDCGMRPVINLESLNEHIAPSISRWRVKGYRKEMGLDDKDRSKRCFFMIPEK